MKFLPIEGRARRLGDDVNTDYIISSHRKKETIDTSVLRNYLLEDLVPGFFTTVREDDILVAGKNFGCGSAMEVAVTVVLAAGIRVVVASSFSRTYLRNAINNGLMPVVCDTSAIAEGDHIAIRLDERNQLVLYANEQALACEPLPPFVLEMLQAGGIVPFLAKNGGFAAAH